MKEAGLKLQKKQRVYVNRSLNMGHLKAIGFDMDHTLLRYRRETFECKVFSMALERLIQMGYPKNLSRLEFNPDSVIRGLLVDKERGNLIKVDGHKYVKLAYHGSRKLDKEERHKLYNAQSFKAQKLRSVDTFFALSEVQLFTEVVDFMRLEPQKIQKPYEQVYQDVQKCIDSCHRDGSLKKIIMQSPSDFVEEDDQVAETLTRLIEGGKSLFLLTNSMWDYTNAIMKYFLNDKHDTFKNWQDYFDYIIVGGGKPAFFTGSAPFYEVVQDSGLLAMHSGNLSTNSVYQGGNADLFQKLTGFRGDEILYVGDHVYGDIIRSKGLFNWRTMLAVPELDSELERLEESADISEKISKILQDLESIDESLQVYRNRVKLQDKMHKRYLEQNSKKADSFIKEKEKLQEKILELENQYATIDTEFKKLLDQRDQAINKTWGPVMKVGIEKSRFAHQLELYACLYTSKVSNLRFYSPFKRFTAPREILPHDL
ncbi:HAD-IG family 5'-nucleotidase [Oligoflexaceae bacterium]|nr:HAD-IG family 5'-nucleotidase [Oligoflexaceae bacterium]